MSSPSQRPPNMGRSSSCEIGGASPTGGSDLNTENARRAVVSRSGWIATRHMLGPRTQRNGRRRSEHLLLPRELRPTLAESRSLPGDLRKAAYWGTDISSTGLDRPRTMGVYKNKRSAHSLL